MTLAGVALDEQIGIEVACCVEAVREWNGVVCRP